MPLGFDAQLSAHAAEHVFGACRIQPKAIGEMTHRDAVGIGEFAVLTGDPKRRGDGDLGIGRERLEMLAIDLVVRSRAASTEVPRSAWSASFLRSEASRAQISPSNPITQSMDSISARSTIWIRPFSSESDTCIQPLNLAT